MTTDTATDGLRARISRQGEDALGRLAQELLESPLVSGALSRAFEAREKAAQAQEVAMGALNLPSAGDLERLTRRVRSVSQRLEGIEDALDRVDERVGAIGGAGALEQRLAAIEAQLVGARPTQLADVAGQLAQPARAGRAATRRRREAVAEAAARDARRERRPSRTRAARGEQARCRQTRRRRGARQAQRRGGDPADPLGGASSASASIRPRAGPSRSLTASTQPACTPRSAASRNSVAASISTASAPSARRRLGVRAVGVVEEVGRDDRARCARRRRAARPPPAPPSAPGRRRRARRRRARGSCRRRQTASRATSTSPSAKPPTSAPHVPTRTSRRAPSRTSSSITIAALGPPIPVLWIVSGSPSAAAPV